MRILSAILIFVSFSYSLGMDENISSINQNSGSCVSMAAAEKNFHCEHSRDASVHHDCHLSHCSFVVLSSGNIRIPDSISETLFVSLISLETVSLSGPRKPPKA